MKTAKTNYAKKVLAAGFLLCSFLISASAQKTTLTLKNGKATVKKNFQPRRVADAHFYSLKLRKGQMVDIKVDANSIYMTEENECSVYFSLSDGKGKEVLIGDSMVGIDEWQGEIERSGNYKIKVYMSGIENFTAGELRKKKPNFKYLLTVQTKWRD